MARNTSAKQRDEEGRAVQQERGRNTQRKDGDDKLTRLAWSGECD